MSAYQPAADPTAVVGKRVVAFIIDGAILTAINLILFVLLADSADADFATCDGLLNQCTTINTTIYGLSFTNAAIVQTVYWVYAIGIFVFLQGFKGFTPGKAAMGLRVVNPDGGVPGPVKALLRWLLLIVDLLPYCIPGLLGFILIMTGDNHTRLGDRVAKTFVVSKADTGRPIGVAAAAAQPYGTPMGAAAPYGAPAEGAPAPGGAPYAPAAPPVSKESPYGGAPPVAEPTTPMAAPSASGTEAQWDPARNAYIQWDAAQGTWLQFDDATQQWTPITQ